MLHQLGLGGGAGGEVLEQGVAGERAHRRREGGGLRVDIAIVEPAGARAAHVDAPDARQGRGGKLVELGGAGGVGQDEGHAAALEPVLQVGPGEQRGGRDDHHPQLDGREHRLPQGHLVAQHEQHAVALFRPLRDQ